ARQYGARECVDPRPFVVGKLAETFQKYPKIGPLLPAMGYSEDQIRDLEDTIARTDCDSVVIGTPIDLTRILKIKQPSARVYYELQEIGTPNLNEVLSDFCQRIKLNIQTK
nr:GTPase [Candidatus Neomarinimicrobiota bacterium]